MITCVPASSALAQRAPRLAPPTRVLVLTASGLEEAWAQRLRVELAPVGASIVLGRLDPDLPFEQSAGAARVAADLVGAQAGVWLGQRDHAVHLVVTETERGYSAPLEPAADPRTIAMVAASLLDEAFRLYDAPAEVAPIRSVAHELHDPASAAPALESTATEPPEAPNTADTAAEPTGNFRAYGGFGTGGLAFLSDVGFDPGSLLRGHLGFAYQTHLRVQAIVEVGFFSERDGVDFGFELQPFTRVCPELAGALPVDPRVSLLAGGHACVGIAENRYFVDFITGGPSLFSESAVLTLAAGGFIAVEIRPTPGLTVTIRADLDGHEPAIDLGGNDITRQSDVLTSLSTQVGFW